MSQLARAFFARDTVAVAQALLGQRLVHVAEGRRLCGLILETEAYVGEADLACHARAGRTPRTAVMYGPPGHAYVYLNYGLHWLLNFVTERNGFPAAVLIRAILPTEGAAVMRARRGAAAARHLADGPGKLTQALGVDGALHGADACAHNARLFVEQAAPPAGAVVRARPRVGIERVPEPWRSRPWNFSLQLAPAHAPQAR